MRFRAFAAALAVVLATAVTAEAGRHTRDLDRVNAEIQGRILDFTHNHGADHRICAPSLGEKRDLYVYLPPGYDDRKRYPVIIWLHGFSQDEKYFLKMAPAFDRAIVSGLLPPVIVAVPDGTTANKPGLNSKASFFINSRLGCYEDFIIRDLWDFLNAHFGLRPEKAAHVLAGASMGGFGAFNLAIKHRDQFQIAVGVLPLLNLRYADCHGDHFAPFDPECQGAKEHYHPLAKAGRFGPIMVRDGMAMRPLFGGRREVDAQIRLENPADMLDPYDVQAGELHMFIAYGGHDQFNCGGEAESFLFIARRRGLSATVVIDPEGKHNKDTAVKFFEPLATWLTPLLAPYVPAP
jgi:S-formylglutathione hydrolase FrmB